MENSGKELLHKLAKAKNQAERDLIMLTSLPKEQKASARIFIEALARAVYPGVTFKR